MIKTQSGDGFIHFRLSNVLVGTFTRGDSSGTNRSGSRRVTWYGKLDLKGFKRTFQPSGTKADVTKAIRTRIKEWLSTQPNKE